MGIPLKDIRSAVAESTDTWLEIEAAASGVDKAAVVRGVLDDWAKAKAHAFKIAYRRLRANGAQTDWLGEDSVDDALPTAHGGVSRKRV